VDFAELAARLEAYREQELISIEKVKQVAAIGMEAW
jgi:hypothetical protein